MFSLSVCLFSCSKDLIDENPEGSGGTSSSTLEYLNQSQFPSIYVQNGMLCFSTINAYKRVVDIDYYQDTISYDTNLVNNTIDTLLDYLGGSLSYTKYGDLFPDDTLYNDEFIGSILNDERMFKVQDWVIQLDAAHEKVYVINDSSGTTQAIQTLNSHSASNPQSLVLDYSTNDDVIAILEDPTDLTAYGIQGCGGIAGTGWSKWVYFHPLNTNVEATPRLNIKYSFYKAGFYHSLWAEVSCSGFNDPAIYNTILAIQVKGPEGWRKRKPCSNNSIGTTSAGFKAIVVNETESKWRFYSGFRNLNGYYFYVRGIGFGTWDGKRSGFKTGFVGRNINSPY